MNGRFKNTIIIAMGCDGLKYTSMAEAFIEKGAKVYISWNGFVDAAHTDLATAHLLQNLVTKKQTIKQAVTDTMNKVGPDPTYESILLYYPDKAENYVIPNIASNLILDDATISGYDPKSICHFHSIDLPCARALTLSASVVYIKYRKKQ